MMAITTCFRCAKCAIVLLIFVIFCATQSLAQNTWSPVGTLTYSGGTTAMHYVSATELYMAGPYIANNNPYLAKWNGTAWSEVGTLVATPNSGGGISTIAYVAANNIYVGGNLADANGNSYVAKWSGTAWSAVGTGANALNANGEIFSLQYVATNNIYAAGSFTNASGYSYVAKWNGTSWSELGTGANALNANSLITNVKYVSATEIYAVGAFTNAAGYQYVAKWNGTTWSELGTGANALNANGEIRTLQRVSATEIYAVGSFYNTATDRGYVAKWNGTSWSEVGVLPFTVTGGYYDTVWDINYKSANEIYIVGALVDMTLEYPVMKWNGTVWNKVGAGFNAPIKNIRREPTNDYLYIGGEFTNANGLSYIAKYVPCIEPTVPTVSVSASTVCPSAAVTLTATGTLNHATAWSWYSGSCGGAAVGTGASIVVNPSTTTTYYVRGTGSCAALGACGSTTITVPQPTRRYVRASATGSNNGTNWANAYTNLQAALDAAATSCGDSIFVAAGTYYPTKDATGNAAPTNARTKTFKIPSGVKVFGGFVGNETQIAQRIIAVIAANPTLLSGDIGTPNVTTDNAFHVVTFINVANTTEINGFVVEKGNANSTASSNFDKGAGIFNNGSGASGSSNPSIYNCTVRSNTATGIGGGMLDYGGNGGSVNTRPSHCNFNTNTAISGGGYYGSGTATTAGSCTSAMYNMLFHHNTVTTDGAGVYINNPTGSVTISYATFANNTIGASKKGRGAFLLAGSLGVYSSISYHGVAQSEIDKTAGSLSNSQVLIGIDPLFVDAAANDYHLLACSPAINAESRSFSNDPTTDLEGNPRAYNGGNKDLGSYERQASNGARRIYVRTSAYGLGNGTSWANAYGSLQTALDVACADTIWVAQGTYYPSKDETGNAAPADPRTLTFRIPSNTVIYGGFVGNETSLAQRPNPMATTATPTLLSGDIGTANNMTDNTYHVVTLRDLSGNTRLNGLTIRDGNANGASGSHYDKGAGIYNYTTIASLTHEPLLENLIITNNAATNGGGVAENNLASNTNGVRYYNCIIKNNTASANGGGIYINSAVGSSFPYFGGCLAYGNTATGNGGGLYITCAANAGMSPSATNVSFAKNTAASGQAIFALKPTGASVSMSIFQSILWNNTGSAAQALSGTNATFIPSNSMIQNYSLTQSTAAANGLTLFTTNVSQTDPAFQQIATDNYELETCSPAVNAGQNTHFLATDAKGSARIFGSNVDYGALELQHTTTISPSIAIVADQTTICAGVGVTFTATSIDGGLAPNYQWQRNGMAVGTNSLTFVTNALNNGDSIRCVMTGSIPCPTGTTPVTSNTIYIIQITPPAVVYVDSSAAAGGNGASWATAYNSLADAVFLGYQCSGVDSIKVAKGTYLPNYPLIKNATLRPLIVAEMPSFFGGPTKAQQYEYNKTFHLRSGLKLVGGYPTGGGARNVAANATVLSGNIGNSAFYTDNTYHVVTAITTNSTTLIDGITVRDGYGSSSTNYSLIHNGHTVWNNRGGGLYMVGQANITVQNSKFLSNRVANNGGGINCDTATITLNNTLFEQNIASGGGGGFANITSLATVTNCQFRNNISSGNGGGLVSYSKSHITVTNCDFISNTVAPILGGGGGMYASVYTKTLINNCVFKGNSAGRGGGFHSVGDTATIKNCLFLNNNATGATVAGGAIGHEGAANGGVNFSMEVYNTTIYGNTSSANIGGFQNATGIATLTNCIVRSNSGNVINGGGATLNITYSNIEGAYPGTGNINADPLFVNTADADGADNTWRTADDGFNLLCGSPSSNAGTSGIAIPVTDLTGAPRPQLGGYDQGAYEKQPETASVSIAATATTICAGTLVTFTAMPTNGGGSPTYQWTKNGNPVGGNSDTYTDSNLANADSIVCTLTSNAPCVIGTYQSSPIYLNVQNPPMLSIAAASSLTPCQGITTLFTASPLSVGAAPYNLVWRKDGNAVGTGNTYSDGGANSGIFTCILYTSGVCYLEQGYMSNALNLVIMPLLVPSVDITATDTTICAGTLVTFTATPTNGGSSPTYQWTKNGNPVGGNSDTYTDSNLANADSIVCTLTSNADCASPTIAQSGTIVMAVLPIVSPNLYINASTTNACVGTSVSFVASFTDAGNAPVFQWLLNGAPVGINSNTYSSNTLANGDVVECYLTGNAPCSSISTAQSNSIAMIITPYTSPSVNITATATTVCNSTIIAFTAQPTNGGSTPSYMWYLNGVNVYNSTNSTYSHSNWEDGDTISCVITSNAYCTTGSLGYSNLIGITVLAPMPDFSLSGNSADVCGAPITCTASGIIDGGNAPAFEWLLNGSVVSNSGTTYTITNPQATDVLQCNMTSSAACATSFVSHTFVPYIAPTVVPSVGIVASATNGCAHTPITFTATATNGGSNPTYAWRKNSTNGVSYSSVYTDNNWANGDTIICTLTSNADCANPTFAQSNALVITVYTPTPSIAGGGAGACPRTLTATGGSSYMWSTGSTAATTSSTLTGNYTVTATDSHGCTATATTAVQCPLLCAFANSNFRHQTNTTNKTVYFYAPTTTGCSGTVRYQWSFQDGAPATYIGTAAPGYITFSSLGSKNICLTTLCINGADTCRTVCCKTVNVANESCGLLNNAFSLGMTSNGLSYGIGLFESDAGTAYSWQIDGALAGAGVLATYGKIPQPTTTVTAAGQHNICLTVSGGNNTNGITCERTNCKTLTLTTSSCLTSNARIAATMLTSSGTPYSVSFTATLSGSSATAYQWTGYALGAGASGTPAWTSTALAPSFNYGAAGIAWVCLTINPNTPCEVRTCMPLNIGATTCANSTNNPAACTAAISSTLRHQTNSTNKAAYFYAPTTTGGTGTIQYNWTFAGGTPATYTGTAAPGYVTFATAGTKQITLTTTRTSGTTVCTSTCSKDIIIVEENFGSVNDAFSLTANSNGTGYVIGTVPNNAGTTYSWLLDGVAAGTGLIAVRQTVPTPTTVVTAAGQHSVCLTLQRGTPVTGVTHEHKVCKNFTILGGNCAASTARFAATVTPSGSNYLVSFTGALSGSAAVTYEWQGYAAGVGANGTPLWTSTNIAPTFTYSATGVYWVCLTINPNTPCATRTCMPITINAMSCGNVSLAANTNGTPITLAPDGSGKPLATASATTDWGNILTYPNPADHQITVSWSGTTAEPVAATLLDALGNTVIVLPVAAANQAIFDTHGLASGIYLVVLHRAGNRFVQRVVIAH